MRPSFSKIWPVQRTEAEIRTSTQKLARRGLPTILHLFRNTSAPPAIPGSPSSRTRRSLEFRIADVRHKTGRSS
jgi:hypothetical protein